MKFGVVLFPVLLVVLLGFLTDAGVAEVSGSTTLINGLRVGQLETFMETSDYVLHMEVDLLNSERIIFADGGAIKVTDGVTTSTLVGSSNWGYAEGVGSDALFSHIFGFTQVNSTSVLVSDWRADCLRIFDREALRTSQFVGSCTNYGFRDGDDALFKYPRSVVNDARSANRVLVADQGNKAVRQVDLITRLTTTLVSRSDGLGTVWNLAFDVEGENLLIVNGDKISEFDFGSQSLSTVAGTWYGGFQNGAFSSALFDEPQEVLSLSESITLLADGANDRLRVINSATGMVDSICSAGSALNCHLFYPYSLLVNNSVIYVGQWEKIKALPLISVE